MRCPEFQRRISDGLAGALPEKKRKRLGAHLVGCPSCRAFERAARLIQEEAPTLTPSVAPEGSWQEGLARLEKSLAAEAAKLGNEPRRATAWKWAFAAATMLLAAAAGLFLILRPSVRPEAQLYLASEERLGLLTFEIEDNPELLDAFNQVLESSLGEEMGAATYAASSGLDNPVLFHEVTDEEMAFVLEELKKEMKS